MRINAVVGFLSILLVITYFLVVKIEVDSFEDMARFVPSSALLYLEQHKAKKLFTQFTLSPLGKTLEKLDFEKTGVEIGFKETSLETIRNIQRIYNEAKDNALVHEILGKRFAFALLAPLNPDRAVTDISFFENNSILICQPAHNAKFLEFLIEKYFNFSDQTLAPSSQYGRHKIHRLFVDGKIISLVRIDGLFVFSLNENQLRLCIDTFDREHPSLQYAKAFNKVRIATDKANRIIYLPLNNIRTVAGRLLKKLDFYGIGLLEKELQTTKGFNGLGYATWNYKKTIENTIIVTFDPNKINAVAGRYLRVAPEVSSMYSFTSKNPMVYYWSNTFDLSYLVDHHIEKHNINGTGFNKFLTEIEKVTGKKVTEIVSFLGTQVSVVIEPARKGSSFELPLFLAAWRTENREALQQSLEAIVNHYKIPTIEKQYGPIRYNYWAQAPEDGIFPLYGFWKDYFFMSNSINLFKKVVDNNAASVSLPQQRDVKAVDPGFTLSNNSVTYTDNKKLFHFIREFLNLLSTLITLEDKNTAGKFRTIVEEIINPLLKGAAMYEKNGTRSYFANNMVVIESRTSLARQKSADQMP